MKHTPWTKETEYASSGYLHVKVVKDLTFAKLHTQTLNVNACLLLHSSLLFSSLLCALPHVTFWNDLVVTGGGQRGELFCVEMG